MKLSVDGGSVGDELLTFRHNAIIAIRDTLCYFSNDTRAVVAQPHILAKGNFLRMAYPKEVKDDTENQ